MTDWAQRQVEEERIQGVAFAQHYFGREVQITNLMPRGQERTPDIYIPQENTLIEVKRVIDNADISRSARWGQIVNSLQEKVNFKLQTINVEGSYLVDTPWDFRLAENRHDAVATALIEAILASADVKTVVTIERITFTITKVNDQDNIVLFSAMGPSGSFDGASQMHSDINHLLPRINDQLSFTNPVINASKKILLLINREPLLTWDWDLYKAISYSYNDLHGFTNIDEIWIQFENKTGFTHKFLYKRSFFERFEQGQINTADEREASLFANWFSTLYEMGEEKRELLLTTLEFYLRGDAKPYRIFPNSGTRIEMVRFGRWLAEVSKYDKLIWLIRKFIDDTDPPKPDDYDIDDDFNLHKKVINNEDVNSITTVLGHLAWSIQSLVLRKEYIVEAYKFTKKLIEHPNYYVKLQAIIPLTEITVRRIFLKEYDQEHNTTYFDRYHQLVYSLFDDLVRYKETRRWLVRLFYHIRDANTEDALLIIRNFLQEPEAASIIVYYALFRQRHTVPNAEFSSREIQSIFEEILTNQTRGENHMKNQIVWNFWTLLQNEVEEFDTVKDFITQLAGQNYQKGLQETILHITREWVERRPEECISWYRNIISHVDEYLRANPEEGRNIWLDYSEDILRLIAQANSQDLINIISHLFNIWMRGAYIGDLPLIFGSYKYIRDANEREVAKSSFQNFYTQMKQENSRLPELPWN